MKLSGATTCPNCKKDHKVEYDLDKLNDNIKPSEISNVQASNQQTIQEIKPEIKEVEVIKTVAPSDAPYFTCTGNNCNELHKNTNYTRKPNKKCKNCDKLNSAKQCTNCKNSDPEEFEELDDDELKDLGIPLPPEDEDGHEGHTHD